MQAEGFLLGHTTNYVTLSTDRLRCMNTCHLSAGMDAVHSAVPHVKIVIKFFHTQCAELFP